MEHFYQKIHGFFNYQDLYQYVIKELPQDAHIVEIGAFKGCSTAFLVVEAINSEKNIKIDVVDTWNGEDGSTRQAWSDYPGMNGDIYEEFKQNLSPVLDKLNPLRMFSSEAVNLYQDGSLDFVFIDGHHSYEGVKEDIQNWRPKLKDGAIFAGHDYNPSSWPGVVKAVHEMFPNKFKVMQDCWIVKL